MIVVGWLVLGDKFSKDLRQILVENFTYDDPKFMVEFSKHLSKNLHENLGEFLGQPQGYLRDKIMAI